MINRLRAILHVLRYGLWYHVEIMNPTIDTRYGKLTSTVISCTQDLEHAREVANAYNQDGNVRVSVIAGYD